MFKPGDMVKIIKKDDAKQGNCWDCQMDKYVGKEVEIFFVRGDNGRNEYNIFIKFEGSSMAQLVNGRHQNGWWFPPSCLELVGRQKEKKYKTSMGVDYCPMCKSTLQDKFSEYAGEMIKKCVACGWC